MKPNPLLHLICLFDLIAAVLEALFGIVLFIACISWFMADASIASVIMLLIVSLASLLCAGLLFIIGRWGDKCYRLDQCYKFCVVVLAVSFACVLLSGFAGRMQASLLFGIVLPILTMWALGKQKNWEKAQNPAAETAAQEALPQEEAPAQEEDDRFPSLEEAEAVPEGAGEEAEADADVAAEPQQENE